jgi:hypothetical protein
MFIIKKCKVGWSSKVYCLLLLLLAPLPTEAKKAVPDPLRAKAIEILSSTRALTLGSIAGGRLTTATGQPVSINNRTAEPTIYYTPYTGSKITLYTGTNWQIFDFSEPSIAVPAGASGDMYDVFIYSNSGIPTLELTGWTNSTTRAVSLAYFEGVRVKSGDATRRYLGSFSLSGSGITEDSSENALLYNYLNQVERFLYRADTTNSHSYDGPLRAFNGNANSKVDFVLGEPGPFSGNIFMGIDNAVGGVSALFAFGYDSYTVGFSTATVFTPAYGVRNVAMNNAVYEAGRHFISVLESTNSGGTATFDNYLLVGTLLM